MRTAQVIFANNYGQFSLPGTQIYHYLLDIDEVKKDDFVIVQAPTGEYKVVSVVGVLDSAHSKATKEVVARLDVSAYEARIAARERRKAIMSELKNIDREEDELERFRRLAARSGRAKDLLAELEAL